MHSHAHAAAGSMYAHPAAPAGPGPVAHGRRGTVGAAGEGLHDGMAPAWVERLAAGEAQRILTYGTSLTAGGAWVEQLEGELQRRYPGEAE